MVLNPDFLEMAGNEIFPKVEFGEVFPRMRLKDAIEPLKVKTGVDFFKFYRAMHHGELTWGEDEVWKKKIDGTYEIPRNNVNDIPDLAHYFDPNKRRLYFRYLDALYNPNKEKPLDYLMMSEVIREGVEVLAVFAVPPPDDPFWKRIEVGDLGKTKFDYLKSKGIFLVLSDLDDPHNADKKEAVEITAPLFARQEPKAVGLLAGKQDDPNAEKYDIMLSSKSVLFRDQPPLNLNLLSTEFLVGDVLTEEMKRKYAAAVPDLIVATPQGVTHTKYLGSIWGNIAVAAAVNYLLTKGLIHKDLIRGPADMKKFEKLFLESCGTFFMLDN